MLLVIKNQTRIPGFIRSWQPAKIATYLVRIYFLLPLTLSLFSLKVLTKFFSLPPNLASSDGYSKTIENPGIPYELKCYWLKSSSFNLFCNGTQFSQSKDKTAKFLHMNLKALFPCAQFKYLHIYQQNTI